MRRVATAAAVAVAAVAAGAPPASASPFQESTFQDDNRLVYASPGAVRRTMDEMKALGADRLRVTVLWKVVAPEPRSRRRPAFDATDPAAYPPGAWTRYDVIVAEAAKRGLGLNFNVTGPGPLWAHGKPPRSDVADTFEPDPTEFAQFVAAVGRRYPTVDYWSIWNEPNHSGWLTPQWSRDGGGHERAAELYRELADGAHAALGVTGHGDDTILVGETAPKGYASKGIKRYLEAMTFVRALYCVNKRYKPLRGSRARELGCERDPRDFRRKHPVLFEATGFAHHPYDLLLPPSFPQLRPNWVTLSNLSTLTRALDRIFRRYGSRRRIPLYLTEYGYQTNPPDRLGVSWKRQAAYLNQAEYLTFRNPRVRTLAQFLLEDDDLDVPASFQTGLRTQSGRRKPAYRAYKLPIWLPRSRLSRPGSVKVWALLRSRPNGRRHVAEVQYKPKGAKRFRRIERVSTRGTRGYLQTRVRVPRTGRLRVKHGKLKSRPSLVRVG